MHSETTGIGLLILALLIYALVTITRKPWWLAVLLFDLDQGKDQE